SDRVRVRAKCCGCTEAFQASRAGSIPVARSSGPGHNGEWRSLVAHPAGGRAVAGSNPVSPISRLAVTVGARQGMEGPQSPPEFALERGSGGFVVPGFRDVWPTMRTARSGVESHAPSHASGRDFAARAAPRLE